MMIIDQAHEPDGEQARATEELINVVRHHLK
jgi:hypothetical protein